MDFGFKPSDGDCWLVRLHHSNGNSQTCVGHWGSRRSSVLPSGLTLGFAMEARGSSSAICSTQKSLVPHNRGTGRDYRFHISGSSGHLAPSAVGFFHAWPMVLA